MLRCISALLPTVFATGMTLAQTTTSYAETTVRDRASIGISYNPCAAELDTERQPQVETIGVYDYGDHYRYHHKLHAWLKWVDAICGVPPPGGASIDLGLLPEGYHRFNVVVEYPDTSVYAFDVGIQVGFTPSDAISGAWYSPEQSGRGLFLTKLPLTPYPTFEQEYSLYWATHDKDGNPTWLLANAPMTNFVVSDQAITTNGAPLSPYPASLQQQSWGTLTFEYLSCGTARLSWDADDPAIEDGSIEIVQLVRPVGLPGCGLSADVEAVWLD